MAHDFAKQRQPKTTGKRNASKKVADNENKVSGHWSWFFSGLFGGLLFAFIIYLGVVKPADLKNLQAQMTEPEEPTQVIPNEEPGLTLDFYDYLEGNEVTVDVIPVDILPEKQTIATVETEIEEPANQNKYLLHAGSFQVALNAESLQARIILLNMNASIVPTIVEGRTWHRVIIGPFSGRSKAEDAKKRLVSNDIDPKVLLMK